MSVIENFFDEYSGYNKTYTKTGNVKDINYSLEGYTTIQSITEEDLNNPATEYVALNTAFESQVTNKDSQNGVKLKNMFLCNFDFRANFHLNFKFPFNLNTTPDYSLLYKINEFSEEIAKIDKLLIEAIQNMNCCDVEETYNKIIVPFFRFLGDHEDIKNCSYNQEKQSEWGDNCGSKFGKTLPHYLLDTARTLTQIYLVVRPLACLLRPLPGNPWMPVDWDFLSFFRYIVDYFDFYYDLVITGKPMDLLIKPTKEFRKSFQNCLQNGAGKVSPVVLTQLQKEGFLIKVKKELNSKKEKLKLLEEKNKELESKYEDFIFNDFTLIKETDNKYTKISIDDKLINFVYTLEELTPYHSDTISIVKNKEIGEIYEKRIEKLLNALGKINQMNQSISGDNRLYNKINENYDKSKGYAFISKVPNCEFDIPYEETKNTDINQLIDKIKTQLDMTNTELKKIKKEIKKNNNTIKILKQEINKLSKYITDNKNKFENFTINDNIIPVVQENLLNNQSEGICGCILSLIDLDLYIPEKINIKTFDYNIGYLRNKFSTLKVKNIIDSSGQKIKQGSKVTELEKLSFDIYDDFIYLNSDNRLNLEIFFSDNLINKLQEYYFKRIDQLHINFNSPIINLIEYTKSEYIENFFNNRKDNADYLLLKSYTKHNTIREMVYNDIEITFEVKDTTKELTVLQSYILSITLQKLINYLEGKKNKFDKIIYDFLNIDIKDYNDLVNDCNQTIKNLTVQRKIEKDITNQSKITVCLKYMNQIKKEFLSGYIYYDYANDADDDRVKRFYNLKATESLDYNNNLQEFYNKISKYINSRNERLNNTLSSFNVNNQGSVVNVIDAYENVSKIDKIIFNIKEVLKEKTLAESLLSIHDFKIIDMDIKTPLNLPCGCDIFCKLLNYLIQYLLSLVQTLIDYLTGLLIDWFMKSWIGKLIKLILAKVKCVLQFIRLRDDLNHLNDLTHNLLESLKNRIKLYEDIICFNVDDIDNQNNVSGIKQDQTLNQEIKNLDQQTENSELVPAENNTSNQDNQNNIDVEVNVDENNTTTIKLKEGVKINKTDLSSNFDNNISVQAELILSPGIIKGPLNNNGFPILEFNCECVNTNCVGCNDDERSNTLNYLDLD